MAVPNPLVLAASQRYGIPASVFAQAEHFAAGVLKGVGAPVTPQNIQALKLWQAAEGGPSDNPLNTTLGQHGAQGSAIKGYGSVPAGINATVSTLKNGLYSPVLSALKEGNDAGEVRQAAIASPWSGSSHYAGTDYAKGVTVPGIPRAQAPTASVPKQPAAVGPTASAAPQAPPLALAQALLRSGGRGLSAEQLLNAAQAPAPVLPTSPLPPPVSSVSPGVARVAPASGPLKYLGPAPAQLAPGSTYAGADQGLDFTNTGRQVPVRALGDAVVTQVMASGSGWGHGNQGLLVYRLTSGPQAGRYVYTAEDFLPSAGLKPGATIKAGDTIGVATGSGASPGIETGFAQNAQGQAYGTPNEGKGGTPPDPQALAFQDFVQNLAPAGVHVHANHRGKLIPYRTQGG